MSNSKVSNSSNTPDVNSLFQTAENEGTLTHQAAQVLNTADLGGDIQAGLGINIDEVPTSEVFLVAILIDDSGSIRFAGNAEAIRDGHNQVVDALGDSSGSDGIFIHNRYLNGTILYPFSEVSSAIKMDSQNYNPSLGTPLYDQTLKILGTVIAEAQKLSSNSINVRTATLIVTDGADTGSMQTAADVKKVVESMLRTEDHIVAAMGFSDGSTDFRQVFRDMGIPENWILTPGNTKSEIRKAFGRFSRVSAKASQSSKDFTQAAIAGFGN